MSTVKKAEGLTHEERLELFCTIIEAFEDFLEYRKIDIPNEEKEQSPETASLIYGSDYMELESEIENILIKYGLLKKEE